MSVFLSSFKIGAISGHFPNGNVSLIFRNNFQKFYPVYYSVFLILSVIRIFLFRSI